MSNMLEAIETGIEGVKQRPFDTYVLGPFMIWYGLRSKGMPPLSRKIIVSAGIWQVMYSWRKYREIPKHVAQSPQKFLALTSGL